jgi:excisionase family DNA binding protein
MQDMDVRGKKPPVSALIPSNQKLLVGRREAADLLSISARAVDYLVANKQLSTRRIGSRVLIPVADLQRFVRADHPDRLAG